MIRMKAKFDGNVELQIHWIFLTVWFALNENSKNLPKELLPLTDVITGETRFLFDWESRGNHCLNLQGFLILLFRIFRLLWLGGCCIIWARKRCPGAVWWKWMVDDQSGDLGRTSGERLTCGPGWCDPSLLHSSSGDVAAMVMLVKPHRVK